MATQNEIIAALHTKPSIDPEDEIRQRIDFLKSYLTESKTKGFVLGISGGQDSTLAGKIAQTAVEELRQDNIDATFYAMRLPYNVQQDEDDAQLALKFINPDKTINFQIKGATDAISDDFKNSTRESITDFNKGNVKARIRMLSQYALAGQNNALVIGTDHAAEAVTGFFTKYGDGAADVVPLAGLNKRQGKQLLQELKAPSKLWEKKPTADLLDDSPGQTDEENLGLSYHDIDDFLEGKEIDAKTAQKIIDLYNKTEHKRQLPVSKYDSWWRDK